MRTSHDIMYINGRLRGIYQIFRHIYSIIQYSPLKCIQIANRWTYSHRQNYGKKIWETIIMEEKRFVTFLSSTGGTCKLKRFFFFCFHNSVGCCILYYILLYFIISYCIIIYYIILYRILYYIYLLYFIISYFIIIYYIILFFYFIIFYYIIFYHIILYYFILYFILLYYILLYCILLYYIILYFIRGRHPVGEWIFIKNDDKTL